MALKIKVDFDLCESNAMCEALAPDIFELDDNDFLVVHTDEVTSENEQRARQAAASCPRNAIALVEE
ncbi:ferredoxin [Nocardioides montaniterrae]